MTATPPMPSAPPFDPPYKCRIVDDANDGAERWVQVLADGSTVACDAPVIAPVVVAPPSTRPQPRAVTTLNVPYAEKDEAKQLGARWDPKRKKWYVPNGVDPAPFGRWLED